MPIVDIEIVGDVRETGGRRARAIARGRGGTGVRIPAREYVGARPHAGPRILCGNAIALAPSDLPVFVTVLKRQLPERNALVREIAELAQAIASTVGRPVARVHIEYAPAAAGRMAFGGTLVE